jgi:hypothetical protein
MDINRNNYEAFLLDLLEGRLSVNEERKLNDFLKQHPEYVADLPDIDLLSLEKPRLSYPLRNQLKKEFPTENTRISAANFDMFSIARMEGDLNSQQEEEHRYMVNVDDLRLEEWSAWQSTRLVPEHIPFPEKKKLRRNKALKGRVLWLSVISAAASLILAFVLLRMDPVEDGPGLSVAGPEELLPPHEQAIALPETPLTAAEKTPMAVIEKEPSLALKEEAAVAVKKPVPEIKQESLAELSESSSQFEPEPVVSRPLRIAGHLSSNSELTSNSSEDRIESLHLPQVSPKLSSLSAVQLASLDRKVLINEFAEEHDISVMSVANAGIKGINKLTGSDITLLASRDEKGEVSGFHLKSKRFSFSRPLAREQ